MEPKKPSGIWGEKFRKRNEAGLSLRGLFLCSKLQNALIRLSSESLKLSFGVFTWTVPLDNIDECCLDEIPVVMRLGGAESTSCSFEGDTAPL